ncbi:MAG: DNA cytosine methyltransferase [Lachnospiraceae bacterium]|nr:DNA cytosine methyltransferase [Lachnospiraceae bacterium]
MNNIRGTALDLFAGIGGMTLAAENAGLDITCAVGTSAKEADIYQYNFGYKPCMVTDDFGTNFSIEELPETDYVLGSISYFRYSSAKIRTGSVSAGKKYWEMNYFFDLIRSKVPKGFVVKLSGCFEKDGYDLIKRISQYGYHVYWQMIDSRLVTGMPVYDKRIYLVGIREDFRIDFKFPEKLNSYVYSVAELRQKENVDPKRIIDPSRIVIEPKAEIYNYRHVKEKAYERGEKPKYIADQYIRYGTWNPSVLNDGQEIRKISVRELARTKFFPDEFDFSGMSPSAAYAAIGKSVNVCVATHVINQLCTMLESYVPERDLSDWPKASEPEYVRHEKKPKQSNTEEKEIVKSNERRNVSDKKALEMYESDGQEKTEAHERTTDGKETKQKIFLSYCQRDRDIADLIEKKLGPLIKKDFYISRDIRDVKYRESFKKFMDTVRDHEYIMMIISDRYLKSVNCMYEVTEAFKDKDFEKKILFFVLSEDDKKYYQSDASGEIAANIYEPVKQARYTLYWQKKEQEISEKIKQINEPVYSRKLTEELTHIKEIEMDLPDFFSYISDARGLPLETHLQTNFRELRDIIYRETSVMVM